MQHHLRLSVEGRSAYCHCRLLGVAELVCVVGDIVAISKEDYKNIKWSFRLNEKEGFVCIFAVGENKGSNQCLHWLQQYATGILRLGHSNPTLAKQKDHPLGGPFVWRRRRDLNSRFYPLKLLRL